MLTISSRSLAQVFRKRHLGRPYEMQSRKCRPVVAASPCPPCAEEGAGSRLEYGLPTPPGDKAQRYFQKSPLIQAGVALPCDATGFPSCTRALSMNGIR
jgi:hypothetical protein